MVALVEEGRTVVVEAVAVVAWGLVEDMAFAWASASAFAFASALTWAWALTLAFAVGVVLAMTVVAFVVVGVEGVAGVAVVVPAAVACGLYTCWRSDLFVHIYSKSLDQGVSFQTWGTV